MFRGKQMFYHPDTRVFSCKNTFQPAATQTPQLKFDFDRRRLSRRELKTLFVLGDSVAMHIYVF